MADIELKCPKCAKVITVSEFADVNQIVCQSCGTPLAKQNTDSATEKTPAKKLGLAVQTVANEQSPVDDEPTGWQHTQEAAKSKRPKRTFVITNVMWSCIIFLILGGIMAYLRYRGGFLATNKELSHTYGPLIILTFHVIIIVIAFKDSVFQGTLCVLIPFYSLYYLFTSCDNFYLRAVVGGFLIGLGQDSGEEFMKWSKIFFDYANDFIQSGGGELKSTHGR